jgi:hypothetical protein
MPELWLTDLAIPIDPASYWTPESRLTAYVLHRTYGAWGGDYSVGKHNPGKTSFHNLVGKVPGKVVQFLPLNRYANHAGVRDYNRGAASTEFEGKNEEPLTDWQVFGGGKILGETCRKLGIRLDYYDGPRITLAQLGNRVTTHNSLAGAHHTDRIARSDWDRLLRAAVTIDYAAVRRLAAADLAQRVRSLPNLPMWDTTTPESKLLTEILQRGLNLVMSAGLAEDGHYGDTTTRAVVRYQQFWNAHKPGTIRDFPGAAQQGTRWMLALQLDAIRDGRA